MSGARRALLTIAAPVAAVVAALVISGLALWGTGNNPFFAYAEMVRYAGSTESVSSIINRSVPLYTSAVAVAIGFKMGLFNIGVEGQYTLAALLSASVGAAVALPGFLHIPLVLVVAIAVGAAWAGIAGVLKATRGISEVISTIMLNFIAVGTVAFLLANFLRETTAGDLRAQTPLMPESAWMPNLNTVLAWVGLDLDPNRSAIYGTVVLAVLLGVGYYLLVWRTRFGFDLRATGMNPEAARASGVNPKVMVVVAMLISGGVAGLVGMSELLSLSHRYGGDGFTTGLGFAGIAVALLGRNNPVGMAVGALLFAFLDRSAQILDLNAIPKEIVLIMQAVILLSAVIAYEVVRRYRVAAEARAAAAATAGSTGSTAPPTPAGAATS